MPHRGTRRIRYVSFVAEYADDILSDCWCCRRNSHVRAVVTTLEALSRPALSAPIFRTAQDGRVMLHSRFCLHTVPAAVATLESLSRATWISLSNWHRQLCTATERVA